MSERTKGMRTVERGVHAAIIHADGFGGERREIEGKKVVNKKENIAAQTLVAERKAAEGGMTREDLLAELEDVNMAIDDADNDALRNEALARKQRIQAQLDAMRNATIAGQRNLREVEEYSSPHEAYGDSVRRYTSFVKELQGAATFESQQISKRLRSRIQDLIPAIAKEEVLKDVVTYGPERYKQLLEKRLAEIEAFEEKEGYEDHAPELIERELLQEKLRQAADLATSQTETSVVERKFNVRSQKAKVTALTNRLTKATTELNKLPGWRIFARRKLIDDIARLTADRALEMAELNAMTRESVVIPTFKPKSEVRMNIPSYEQEQEEAEEAAMAAK